MNSNDKATIVARIVQYNDLLQNANPHIKSIASAYVRYSTEALMLEKDTFGQSASRCDARSICQPYPNAWKVSLSNWNASIRATRRANGSDRSNETAGKSLDTVELLSLIHI